MPRPIKEGLDYFNLDVKLDDKFYMVEVELGLEGFALLIKLLQKIYSQSYYLEWGEKREKIFAHQNKIDVEKVKKLLKVCFEEEVFSKKKYKKYQILTSNGIQKRYFEAIKKRKEIHVIKEYLINKIDQYIDSDINSINVVINSIDSNINSIDSNIYKQSKVKKRKEKNNKAKKSLCQDSKESPDPANFKIAYKATCYLIDRILDNNPRARMPNKDPIDSLMKKWVVEMERLHRLGPVGAEESDNKGYSWKEIKKIINWCQDDNFWKTNILSTAKLREKITTLESRMKRNTKKKEEVTVMARYKKALKKDQEAERRRNEKC